METILLNLNVKNPCVDQDFVKIEPMPLNPLQYTIGSGEVLF